MPSSLRLVPTEPGQSRYAALAAAMRARIVAGEWPPGSAIPAEQTLAAEHGVALGTMRRALDLLHGDELTLDLVAEASGFADARSLRRAIKRWTGHTPTHFRSHG